MGGYGVDPRNYGVDPRNYLSPNSSMPPAPLRLQVCCRVWCGRCGVVRVLQCEDVLQCGNYLSLSSVMPSVPLHLRVSCKVDGKKPPPPGGSSSRVGSK